MNTISNGCKILIQFMSDRCRISTPIPIKIVLRRHYAIGLNNCFIICNSILVFIFPFSIVGANMHLASLWSKNLRGITFTTKTKVIVLCIYCLIKRTYWKSYIKWNKIPQLNTGTISCNLFKKSISCKHLAESVIMKNVSSWF